MTMFRPVLESGTAATPARNRPLPTAGAEFREGARPSRLGTGASQPPRRQSERGEPQDAFRRMLRLFRGVGCPRNAVSLGKAERRPDRLQLVPGEIPLPMLLFVLLSDTHSGVRAFWNAVVLRRRCEHRTHDGDDIVGDRGLFPQPVTNAGDIRQGDFRRRRLPMSGSTCALRTWLVMSGGGRLPLRADVLGHERFSHLGYRIGLPFLATRLAGLSPRATAPGRTSRARRRASSGVRCSP